MSKEMIISVMSRDRTGIVGDSVSFGGLFGASPIMAVRNVGKSSRFIGWGGRIPAPVHSFKN